MRKWFGILVPVLVLGLLIGWRVQQRAAEAGEQARLRAARKDAAAVAATAQAQVRDVTQSFVATGTVESPMNVKIAPKVTGRIEFLRVHEGDRVTRGQVLVRIDDSEVEAEVQHQAAAVAEARYRLAQAQLNQNPTDVAVAAQISQQKAAVESAKADLEQARESREAATRSAEADLTQSQSAVENARAALKSAEANLTNAKSRYDRASGLHRRGFVPAQEVEDAQAALTVHESAVGAATAQVRAAEAQEQAARLRLIAVKSRGSAEVEAAQARAVFATSALESARANLSQTAAYRKSIEALRSGVAAAEASLRSAQARRRDTVLVSPLDGYVTGRYSDEGAIASPTQPILSVEFVNSVWVRAAVPEEVCARLHLGQLAKVTFEALSDRTFEASIIQINPSADPVSRQYTVRMLIDNRENRLKPGMFARVTLETDRAEKLIVVPREAVQRDGGGSAVVVVGPDGTARRTPVTTGVEDAKFVAVTGALRPGDTVVTMSASPIKNGQTVVREGAQRPGGRSGNNPKEAGAK